MVPWLSGAVCGPWQARKFPTTQALITVQDLYNDYLTAGYTYNKTTTKLDIGYTNNGI